MFVLIFLSYDLSIFPFYSSFSFTFLYFAPWLTSVLNRLVVLPIGISQFFLVSCIYEQGDGMWSNSLDRLYTILNYNNVTHETAQIAWKTIMGPQCMLGEGSTLEEKCSDKIVVGRHCRIGSNVKIIDKWPRRGRASREALRGLNVLSYPVCIRKKKKFASKLSIFEFCSLVYHIKMIYNRVMS